MAGDYDGVSDNSDNLTMFVETVLLQVQLCGHLDQPCMHIFRSYTIVLLDG